MSSQTLVVAASKVALDLLRSDELPDVAASAIEAGYDSPSLRTLAGLIPADAGVAKMLFCQALAELRLDPISKREAVVCLARETAKEILSETVDPQTGANKIWRLSLLIPDEPFPELDSFVYAASEWDDRPEDYDVFEEGVLVAAESLLRVRQV